MLNKRGFTLTEVLITLGIIGVIGALTIPALIQNGQNEANAAKLSVVVSNIENALTTMIAREGATTLYGTRAWGVVQGVDWNSDDHNQPGNDYIDPSNNVAQLNRSSNEDQIAEFVGRLGEFLYVSGFSRDSYTEYYDNDGPYALAGDFSQGALINPNNADPFAIELKNGAVIWARVFANGDGLSKVTQEDIDEIHRAGGTLISEAADITIDVNGKNPPNTRGRDIFIFYLGSDGILYPCGGLDVAIYGDGTRADTWNGSGNMWRCIEGNVQNNGGGCTARVIQEGYKITY